MQSLRNAELPVSPWQNGAGRKSDLAEGPGWMTGFAWLDADAPFSHMAGMDRTITLVHGPGFVLHIAGHPLPVTTRYVPADFDGGQPTECRIAGPSRVLNVVTDRARLCHAITITRPVAATTLETAGCVACFAVLLEGAARAEDGTDEVALDPLDAVRLAGPATLTCIPGSVIACIRITKAS